jgi:hypothetical protein
MPLELMGIIYEISYHCVALPTFWCLIAQAGVEKFHS